MVNRFFARIFFVCNKGYVVGGDNSVGGNNSDDGRLDSMEELDLSLRTPRWTTTAHQETIWMLRRCTSQ